MSERELFEAVLERPISERARFLDEACASDPSQRGRVEALLAAHAESESFLEKPAMAADFTGAYQPINEGQGTIIGAYKLLQQIGEGGCGVVYMAEQERPVRRIIALKIIKPGMDTNQVIARFESERQALALMDHPNIAKVLDAGATDSGRPYFVMELVKGVPITEFCDKNHMPAEGRLKLFIDVCHAIQHAHHKGVIHRDIKPSNVMVTLHDGVPVVKVIDFGVSKATAQKLTERTLFTAYGQMIGTPAYMSPEQAEMSGLDIDTRSDVYSLGVLLYELLTGTTPLDVAQLREAGYVEMQRLIRQQEAPRPSTRMSSLGESATVLASNRGLEVKKLAQLLIGDLDWVVMKALDKDRNRRYDTPGNFGEDIERYLHREAILARPPSTLYRLKKFSQRNRATVLTMTAVAALLVVGTAVATWQALRATRAEQDAILERDEKNRAWQAEASLRRTADSAREDAIQQNAAAVEAEGVALTEADRNRRLLYSADVHLASQVWDAEDGTAFQCNELLRGQFPGEGQSDLREFCWRYQWGLMQQSSEVRLPPARRTAGVTADNRVVTLDEKGNVNSWLIGDRRQSQQSTLDGGGLFRLTLSRTGEVAAVIDAGGSLKIFDARTGLPKGAVHAPSALTAIRLSADGLLAVGVGRDEHARVWGVAEGKELYDYPLTGVLAPGIPYMDLSLDGKLLLLSGDNPSNGAAVVLYQNGSPKPIVLDNEEGTGFSRYQGELSPDGKLAALGHAGNYVDLYDTTTQKLLGSLRARSQPFRVAFSPDGSQLAVGEKTGLVTLWEIARQQVVRVLKGHSAAIDALVFTSDGRKLISLDRDGATRCWILNNQQQSRVFQEGRGQINSLSYSPDGRYLVEAGINKLVVHDLRSKHEPQSLSVQGTSIARFSPDGQTIAAGVEGGVSLWQVGAAERLYTLSKSPDEVGSIAFSPDGHWLAAGFGIPTDFGEDQPHKVKIFDVKSRKEQRSFATPTQVTAVAFSLDGKLLAAAGHDGTVWLWDVANWNELGRWTGPDGTYYESILFLPGDRELAIGSISGRIDIWDVGSGRLKRSLRGHGDGVSTMALSSDGRTLATGSLDHSIKLWDIGTDRELRTLYGHTSWLYTVTFSPDGNTLASSGVDGVLRFWEAPSIESVAADLAEIGRITSFAVPPQIAR